MSHWEVLVLVSCLSGQRRSELLSACLNLPTHFRILLKWTFEFYSHKALYIYMKHLSYYCAHLCYTVCYISTFCRSNHLYFNSHFKCAPPTTCTTHSSSSSSDPFSVAFSLSKDYFHNSFRHLVHRWFYFSPMAGNTNTASPPVKRGAFSEATCPQTTV